MASQDFNSVSIIGGSISGISPPLPIASGGTNSIAVPTAGTVSYGTGVAYGFTLAGTSGQVLTSSGSGVPTWTTPAVGTVTSVTGSGNIASSGGTTPNITFTGILPIVNGGTNTTATPTLGAVVYGTGTAQAYTATGSSGQFLTSAGGAAPTWTSAITDISVVSANGLAGTSSGGATPALTLSTSITGLLKGNGTAISAAVANTDYVGISAPITKTADFSVSNGETWFINNKSASTCTVTLPAASSWSGRQLTFKNMQAQTLVSATSNIVPIDSTTAGTSILLGVVGNWATVVSDGTNWVIMQAAANNSLLLE